jgi:ATP-dependent Clp protease ATP-binding subunit ClpC
MNLLAQFRCLAALLLLLLQKTADAFVGTRYNGQQIAAFQKRSTTSLMVFERMSENCIGAIVSGQKQAQKFSQTQLETPFLFAGVIDMPESSAMERTYKQYGITWRKTVQALQELYPAQEQSASLGAFFKSRDPDDDLPFARDVQRVLKSAGNVADQMGSKVIQSQHLLLALLEFKEGNPSTAVTDSANNGSLALINKIDPKIKAIDMCESLLGHMQENEDKERDLVTGIGEGAGTKTLDECGVDLTAQAQDGLLDIVQGRDKEILSCIRTLVRRRKNNAVLIGEPGVGKTAIAEGIAQVLVSPECPARLKGTRLMSLELSTLVAGTKYRGEFEERLQSIIQEVTDPKAPPTILFIDEIHNLVGAGAAEGGMDAANLLKPALARGQLQVIGATTIAEYRKHIEKDAALERRLQPCMVKEPSVPETTEILRAIVGSYEDHHRVKYTPESLVAAAQLSERYLTDRFLPDKVRLDDLNYLRAQCLLLTIFRSFLYTRQSTCWMKLGQ